MTALGLAWLASRVPRVALVIPVLAAPPPDNPAIGGAVGGGLIALGIVAVLIIMGSSKGRGGRR